MVSQTETTHPSDALLLATIHAEPVDELAAVRAHARECAQCTARQRSLADDDAMTGALLGELDDPPRTADQPRFVRRSSRRWVRRGLRVGGAAATLAVAAAALVVPASPLHRLVSRGIDAPSPNSIPAAVPAAAPAAASGIAVPASRSLVVVFRHEQSQGAVDITRTGTGDITFRSHGGNAAYQVAADQVSIDNSFPADAYQIDIPRGVQQVRILVGTRVLLRWPEDSAHRVGTSQPGPLHIPLAAGITNAP